MHPPATNSRDHFNKAPSENCVKQLIRIAFMVSVVACGSPIPVETVVLYDSQEGTALDQQGWAYVTRPLLVAKAQRSFSEGS